MLHAGTGKTGTTALQQTLFRHVDVLAKQGVWYPPLDVEPIQKKHQYLVELLRAGDSLGLACRLREIIGARTVMLSTEGLFNHWWDYSAQSKAMLRQLSAPFDLEVWVCFREPLAFALSVYAQLLRNPRLPDYSPVYGLDVGLEEMLETEWFVQRLDYLGFVQEVAQWIRPGHVKVFRLHGAFASSARKAGLPSRR